MGRSAGVLGMEQYRTTKAKGILFCKGLMMGMADVIPGVSGGTIAFISGIYEHLIAAICSVQLKHATAVFKFIFGFWAPKVRNQSLKSLAEIQWHFFIPLGLGVVLAILSMAKIVPLFLKQYPFYTYSLFFGLIVFSVTVPYRKIKHTVANYALIGLFTVIMYLLLGTETSLTGSVNPLYIFISGSIAICAMILPGLSGAYILVLMGQYVPVLEALHEKNFNVILPFVFGIAVGILSFARLLKWFLKKYHSATMSGLTGIMIGSLRKIWPGNYSDSLELNSSAITAAVCLALGGALLILALEKISLTLKDPESPV